MGDEEEEASLGAVRYPVMPSLVALQQMRNRLHLAQLGKKLMKWTALATGKELRRLSMEMTEIMKDYGVTVRNAFMLLARARYFFPEMNTTVLEGVSKQACVTVASSPRSVSGVKVTNLHLVEMGCDSYRYLGMSKGGIVIKECKEAWLEILRMLVLLCQFRTTFVLIDLAHKNATKKQNVLSRCVIPRIIITMRYILSELDEQEREESFRLKRFKQLKYKNAGPDKRKEDQDEDEEQEPKKPEPEPEPKPKPQPKVELKPEPIPAPKPEQKPEPKVELKPEPIPAPKPEQKPEPKPEPKVEPIPAPIPAPKPAEPITEPIVEPIVVPEPPKLDPLELLMNHIIEVVRLAEKLETEPTPEKEFGLTICDLGKLKVQLKKLIELSEGPIKDRVCSKCGVIGRAVSSCSCQTKLEAPTPVQTGDFKTPKPEGFETAMKLMPTSKVKTTIPEYILKPRPMDDLMGTSKPLNLEAMSKNRIEELENHVDQVICMTNHYQCEGLLSKSAEDFLKCCKSVKIKIQEFQYQKIVKAKLDRLKDKVTNLEKITTIVQKEDLSAATVSSFMSCCKEFKAKLDRLKSCRGTPSVSSVEKLLNKIDYSILLSKEAKDKGLVSESVEEFIKSCVEIKTKIEPHNEPKPQVIDDLLFNLNDIISFITKYKDGALISNSIERFYQNCQTTKAKLDSYKAGPPGAGCGKSSCPKIPPKTPPPECSCPCIKASSHAPSEISCSAGASVSRQGTTTTCGGQSAVSQQSQHSFKSKSTEGSAPPPCTESTCVHIQPSTRSCNSQYYQIAHPEKSKSAEKGRNLLAVKSRSQSSVKVIIIPKEKKKKKDLKAGQRKVSTTRTVRTYKEVDGRIVEELETITVEQCVYDGQKPPSKTSSCGSCASTAKLRDDDLQKPPSKISLCESCASTGKKRDNDSQKPPSKISLCGSCASRNSANRVNVCKIPVTKGFIQTVRDIKSETLIRNFDLSSPCSPFVWSCVSAETLIPLERSHENETVEQDPFFCASPATSDDDSVLPM